MGLKKVAFLTLTVAVLFTGAAVAWVLLEQPQIFSDPAKPRKVDAYETLVNAAPKSAPELPDQLFGPILVESNNAQVTLSMRKAAELPGPQLYDFTRHRILAGESLSIGSGSISLAYLATGYGVPGKPYDYSFRVTPRYFDPQLRPITRDDAKKKAPIWDPEMGFSGEFPTLELCFSKTNIPEFKALTFQCFDARTHWSITSGHSSQSGDNWFRYETEAHLWHQTPIEAVLTFATGPTRTITMKATAGAEARFPGIVLKLTGIFDANITSWGSSDRNGTNTVNLGFQQSDPSQRSFALVFFAWPAGFSLPLSVEAFDTAGKKLEPSNGGGASGQVIITQFAGSARDLGEIRLRYFPNIHQVIVTLPEIPGLPEQNRGVKNLFDVHIPYSRYRSEYEFQTAFQSLVALNMPHLALTYPNGHFPREYTNATPKLLLKEIQQHLPPKQRLAVSQERHSIELSKPAWQIILDRLRAIIQK